MDERTGTRVDERALDAIFRVPRSVDNFIDRPVPDEVLRRGIATETMTFLPKPFTARALLQMGRETLSAPAVEASAGDA